MKNSRLYVFLLGKSYDWRPWPIRQHGLYLGTQVRPIRRGRRRTILRLADLHLSGRYNYRRNLSRLSEVVKTKTNTLFHLHTINHWHIDRKLLLQQVHLYTWLPHELPKYWLQLGCDRKVHGRNRPWQHDWCMLQRNTPHGLVWLSHCWLLCRCITIFRRRPISNTRQQELPNLDVHPDAFRKYLFACSFYVAGPRVSLLLHVERVERPCTQDNQQVLLRWPRTRLSITLKNEKQGEVESHSTWRLHKPLVQKSIVDHHWNYAIPLSKRTTFHRSSGLIRVWWSSRKF